MLATRQANLGTARSRNPVGTPRANWPDGVAAGTPRRRGGRTKQSLSVFTVRYPEIFSFGSLRCVTRSHVAVDVGGDSCYDATSLMPRATASHLRTKTKWVVRMYATYSTQVSTRALRVFVRLFGRKNWCGLVMEATRGTSTDSPFPLRFYGLLLTCQRVTPSCSRARPGPTTAHHAYVFPGDDACSEVK
jgi:hypothetical protein